jgi:hypothetical protein
MAVTITTIIRSSAQQWRCAVTLESYTVISDPVAYITASATVQAEVIALAGLDADLVFVAAALESAGQVGTLRQYRLLVTFGAALTSGSHTHGCETVEYPLQCGYNAGPTVDLDATLGPVVLQRPTTADIIMLRVKAGATDLFRVGLGTVTRFGTHAEFSPDATYDIGTSDGGGTLLRPRDLRVGRDLYAVGNGRVGGFGIFGSYVRGSYHVFAPQAVNPSADATVRHVYVNSVDSTLRYWNGAVEQILGTTSGSDTLGIWDCPGGLTVGQVVYCTGVDNYVDAADASTLAGRQPLGICVAKPDAGHATVRYVGEIALFGGLVAGAAYFVARGAPGTITRSLVGFVAGDTLATLGVAKNATTLTLLPTAPEQF